MRHGECLAVAVDELSRLVGRPVIGDDHLAGQDVLDHDGLEYQLQEGRVVVGGDDERCVGCDVHKAIQMD